MAITALIRFGEISASGTSIRCSLAMVKTSRSAASKRMFALAMSENARSSFLLGMLPIKSMTNQPNTAKNSSPTVAATRTCHGRACQRENVIDANRCNGRSSQNGRFRGHLWCLAPTNTLWCLAPINTRSESLVSHGWCQAPSNLSILRMVVRRISKETTMRFMMLVIPKGYETAQPDADARRRGRRRR